MFRLLAQFVFLAIRLVPRNMVMVAIDMCRKSPINGEWIYGITCKYVYFYIPVLFIVYTTSILKSVLPITYCFCLDSHFSDYINVIINVAVAFLFYYCNRYSYLCYHGYHQYCYFCYAYHILL